MVRILVTVLGLAMLMTTVVGCHAEAGVGETHVGVAR